MTRTGWQKIVAAAAIALGLTGIAATGCSSTPAAGDGGTNCGTGSTQCGDTCTVVARDTQNCGSCGKSCMAGEVCSQGTCASSCGGGTTKCGNECVDNKSDPRNCGMCSKACAANEVCMAGACATACGMGTTKCGMSCVNAMTDPTNCGMCGTLCKAGEACMSGTCQLSCQAGLTACTGVPVDGGADAAVGPSCADLQTNPFNCGMCGKACSQKFGAKCVAGQCVSSASCLAILQDLPNSVNGTYTIDPDGAGVLPPVQVYCDMTNGGQTVYRVTRNWGEWGMGMNVVVRDVLAPSVGTIGEWDANCALFNKTKYVGAWKNTGQTYSLNQYTVYADSKDYWNNQLLAVFPTALYNQILILQDSVTPNCWAWYAEAGSLQSFGSPTGAGYAFCRSGSTASQRYHIYLCLP